MFRFALLTVAAVSIATSAQAGSCAMSSASGLGVTKDIAMFMSDKALHNMLVARGETGKGKITTTCDSSAIVTTTCISKQKSCK